MKDPLEVTVNDISAVISALDAKGIGMQITLTPIVKNERDEKKKPVLKHEIHHCPNCNGFMYIMHGDNFCSKCGQALDWSDTE